MYSWAGHRGKGVTEKLADLEMDNAASKTAPKGRGKKRATAANKRVATLETELVDAKTLHLRLVQVATRSEADFNKARTDLRHFQAHLGEVEQEVKLAREDLGKLRKQFAGLAKSAEKALRQLMEVSNQVQAIEIEAGLL